MDTQPEPCGWFRCPHCDHEHEIYEWDKFFLIALNYPDKVTINKEKWEIESMLLEDTPK